METATVQAGPAAGVTSSTVADLLPIAARDARWPTARSCTSGRRRELGRDSPTPRSAKSSAGLSLGLIDLGIEKGDKVAILANTRAEWTYFDFAALTAGATVVPIYQTNSPEECQYVLENSDAKAVIVEDAEQLAKIREVRDRCPDLEHVILMTGERRRRDLARPSWPSAAPSATPPSGRSATSSVDARRHLHLHLHVGHDRPAEGLRDLPRQLPVDARHGPRRRRARRRRAHLPLPPPRPLLRPADPVRHRRAGRERSPTGSGTR